MNGFCGHCGEQTLCPSVCEECSTPEAKIVYCGVCRPPPCSKSRCPIGHHMEADYHLDYDTTCDLCGISAKIYENKAYHDEDCNFSVCVECHRKLPADHPLIPLHTTLRKEQQLPSSSSSDDE